MRWAVLLGSPAISGGTYVIFEHTIRALRNGEDITIVTMQEVDMDELYWHEEAKKLKWKTYDELENSNEEFDVCIATWWRSVYEAYRINAKRYLYFVQSIESKFYDAKEKPTCQLVEATYLQSFEIITEATWIKEYLERKYKKCPILVHNGIRKDIYKEAGDAYAKREPGKLRVLVEGPIDVPFKNVPKTIELCKRSNADEIWLMTSSDISSYEGVDKVFSRVPIFDTPKVYRSCDVIIKLSYVEGMFGPPLEMFHCGGTSITYDVTGCDEYIKHEYNGLVVETDDDEKVVEYINKLKADEKYLEKLKIGAKDTASNWDSWEKASENFKEAVYELYDKPSTITREDIQLESKFNFDSYVIAEDYLNELKLLRSNLGNSSFATKIVMKLRNPDSGLRKYWVRFKRLFPNSFKQKCKDFLHIEGTDI